jgi:cytochrome c biogenesis protein CcmG/thiol:disulfide interchange protein DsbE
MVAMKRFLSPFSVAAAVGVVALIGLLAYGLASNEPDRGIEQALARGERPAAPRIELPRLSGGGRESLQRYRGKVVVLNFWASWCVPCRQESPLLQRWHERISQGGRGTVLGIDILDVSGDARDFAREYDLTYPMLRDGDGDSLDDWGVVAYPETFVIDRRGRIAASRRGPVDRGFLRDEVLPLIEEPT